MGVYGDEIFHLEKLDLVRRNIRFTKYLPKVTKILNSSPNNKIYVSLVIK